MLHFSFLGAVILYQEGWVSVCGGLGPLPLRISNAIALIALKYIVHLRIPDNYDAKIAKICNLWTFWLVLQLKRLLSDNGPPLS